MTAGDPMPNQFHVAYSANCTTFQMVGTAASTGIISLNTSCQPLHFEATADTSGTFAGTICANNSFYYPSIATPEQEAAIAAEQARWAAECEARLKKSAQVDRKANKLLRETVGARQYAAYRKLGYFELIGQSGRRYRLWLQKRVQVMAETFGDKIDYEICIIHGEEYVPAIDKLVTLILLILSGEAGEKILHEKGNRRAA